MFGLEVSFSKLERQVLHLLAAVHMEHLVPHREQILASVKKYVFAHVLHAVLFKHYLQLFWFATHYCWYEHQRRQRKKSAILRNIVVLYIYDAEMKTSMLVENTLVPHKNALQRTTKIYSRKREIV